MRAGGRVPISKGADAGLPVLLIPNCIFEEAPQPQRVPSAGSAPSLAGAGESIQMDAMNNGTNRSRQPAGHTYVPRQQRQSGPAIDPRRNYERYVALAREAATAGDAIQTEHWYQHAEHYLRMMKERTA